MLPINLSAFHPFPDYVVDFDYRALFPVGVFVGISAFAIERYRTGRKHWLCVWMIYLITLSPVIGLIHSGPQAAADRYAHLTTLGFYVLLAAGVVRAWEHVSRSGRGGIVLALMKLAIALGWTSHQQSYIWRDDLSLWQSVAQRYPGRSALVHNNLGNALFSVGRFGEAEAQYLNALSVPGVHANAYFNLYNVLRAQNQHDRALELFTELSQRDPLPAVSLEILGEVYENQGEWGAAETHYRLALQIEPAFARSHYRLARLYLQEGENDRAANELSEAIRIAPDYVDAMLLLAQIKGGHSSLAEALDLYWQSYEISPTYAPAYQALIGCLRSLGLDAEADLIFDRVSRLRGFESL